MELNTVWIGIVTLMLVMLIYVLTKNSDKIFEFLINNWTPRIVGLLKDMPCPSHMFGFGVALDVQGSPDEVFEKMRQYVEKCPRIFKLWVVNYATVHLIHPDDVEKILTHKSGRKSVLYAFLTGWLQEGLLLSTGSKWHHRRKLLTPAFHFSILKQFTNVFGEQSFKFVKKLQKDCGGPSVGISDNLIEYTLNSITETAMGYRHDATENTEMKKYRSALHSYGECIFHITLRPWLYPNVVNQSSLLSVGRMFKRNIKCLKDFSRNVIKKRVDEFNNSINSTEKIDDDDTMMKKKRLAMLDLLISQKYNGSIDDAGIAEEVDTFIFAGHETTSIALTFLLMLLANHRDIQDRIHDEVISIMGDDRSKLPDYNDLQNMVYLERCIKEGLRLYPPVWFVARKLEEDVQLDDYLLPAKVDVFIHIFYIHRNPDFWPNPNFFDPDRFLPENTQKRHPYSYIPFSAGARNCIGQKYALLQEKALVSTLLRHFILEPVDTPETITLMVDMLLRTKNGIKIKVLPRP